MSHEKAVKASQWLMSTQPCYIVHGKGGIYFYVINIKTGGELRFTDEELIAEAESLGWKAE